jgi:hypothetical protein
MEEHNKKKVEEEISKEPNAENPLLYLTLS